jgi:cytochrome c oxidase assembly protein subunit 11
MDVKIGETALAFFRATNNSDRPVTGQAAYNVTPEVFGAYFNKIQCFCFTEQTLKPHQTVEMPVTFFIDPKMVDDSDTATQSEVTLSYIFYPVDHPAAATADASAPAKSGG